MSTRRTVSQNLFSTSKLKSESRMLRSFLKRILIKVLFQNFFYFWALNIVVGVECVPIFQQSVDACLYEWLLAEQKRRKARTVQDVIRQVLHRLEGRMERIECMQRIILNGLKGAGYFNFDIPMLQKFACEDAVDLEIMQRLYEAGRGGMFPKDVAGELSEYKLAYWHVSRRIVRMNKRLEHETGERLFEKRGHKWALTSFAFEVFGTSENEVKEDKTAPEEEEM
jgi:hypothetical protein